MKRWFATLARGSGAPDPISEHAIRERRLDGIRDAVEQFAFGLGLLIAGHDAPTETSDHDLTTQLQQQLRPFLDAGDAMRPDFGAFGDLRIEGELLQLERPVLATLDFDDRCARETAHGRVVPARGRRMRMTMHVAIEPARVLDCAMSEVTVRRG